METYSSSELLFLSQLLRVLIALSTPLPAHFLKNFTGLQEVYHLRLHLLPVKSLHLMLLQYNKGQPTHLKWYNSLRPIQLQSPLTFFSSFFLYFWNKISHKPRLSLNSLYNHDWPRTSYPPISTFRELGLQVHTIMLSSEAFLVTTSLSITAFCQILLIPTTYSQAQSKLLFPSKVIVY